mgnify:CR=1 FL=1
MFVKMICYGGIDWHDSKMIIQQMKWENQFDIPATKVTDCIVNDIIEEIPYLDPLDVYDAVLNNQSYRFPLLYLSNDKVVFPTEDGIGYWDSYGEIKGNSLEENFCQGQVSYQIDYEISDIPKEQLCYIVEEHFHAYTKGVPLVERFYHEPFRVLDEAEDFLKRMKRHDERSKVSIQAYNLSEISLTDWFRTNMEVIRLSSGDAENGYAVFVDSHLANLQKILK